MLQLTELLLHLLKNYRQAFFAIKPIVLWRLTKYWKGNCFVGGWVALFGKKKTTQIYYYRWDEGSWENNFVKWNLICLFFSTDWTIQILINKNIIQFWTWVFPSQICKKINISKAVNYILKSISLEQMHRNCVPDSKLHSCYFRT